MEVYYKYKIRFCKNCQTMRLAMYFYEIVSDNIKNTPLYTLEELEEMTKEELDDVNYIEFRFVRKKCTVCKNNLK